MKIIHRIALALFLVSLMAAFHLPAAEAAAAAGVHLGSLICKSLPGRTVKEFTRSAVAVDCTFKTPLGEERYRGEIGFLGIDLSQKSEEILYFTVFGLAADVKMGAHSLAGGYVGTTFSGGIGAGVGSTQFVGGLKKSFSLVPSLDTFKGTGLTIGTTRMNLNPAPRR